LKWNPTAHTWVSPHSIATNRSSPRAIPPCGGAPWDSASSKWENWTTLCAGSFKHCEKW
jgi:hypothetical protein